MIHEDFYSGQQTDDQIQEQEATQMASFGTSQYDFDPASRMMSQQQVTYQQGFSANSPPLYGIGSPLRYDQYGNPMPTYNQFKAQYQNPAFAMNPQLAQPPEDKPTTIIVPGVNSNGEYLPPLDVDEKIDLMQREYWQKYQEQEAERLVKQNNSTYYGGSGFNYYGTPYYNPWQYNSLNAEINKDVEEMKNNARQARLDLNVQMSQLAHNFVGDNISEEAIRERYEGKVIELPQQSNWTMREAQELTRIDNMVEFDNSQLYQAQYAAASKTMNDIIPKDADMNELFKNIGVVASTWELEDELHRRKDYTGTYQSSDGSYRYFVRKKAEERYARENGIDLHHLSQRFNPQDARQQSLDGFPTLKESVTLSSDGTLNVTCNVGSNAGQTYSVNENEGKFQEKKERFARFLSAIPGVIYNKQNE